ncbi:AfsR/SARP family transcriptional regulator [Actinacidiphila rubida]|uniref:AfsR/SARP family transcriptional regulator n=1 Tax=Actinacidiphila rubida TaxID=310780 RepID=UPI000943ADC4|nr:BTAD domain-containing putative transcriptional regulator [Actinacidiphila rubida]
MRHDARANRENAREKSENNVLTSADAATAVPREGRTRFTVLGLLSVTDGRDSVALQPSRPASLLAALLLHANSAVSTEFLQRVIWGEATPAQAKPALHSCVLRLRRLFGKYGVSGNAIEAVPGGYRLTADAETLDLVEFRELLVQAYSAGDADTELRLLRAALALWKPPLMANVHSDLLHRDEVPRLKEEWLRAIERVFDLELACGRHREALAEIWPAARAHPLHERFTEQLMEALRRAGRRAEALSEYRKAKEHLADQLGVDPGPALQRLELEILRGSPDPASEPASASAPAHSDGSAAAAPAGHRADRRVGTPAGPGAAPRTPHAPGTERPPGTASAAAGTPAGTGASGTGPAGTGPSATARNGTALGAAPSGTAARSGHPPAAAAPDDAEPGTAEGALISGEGVLDRLVGAGLLQEGPRGHYRMHELLRAFARAAAAEGVGARTARTARTTTPTPRHGAVDLHPTEA